MTPLILTYFFQGLTSVQNIVALLFNSVMLSHLNFIMSERFVCFLIRINLKQKEANSDVLRITFQMFSAVRNKEFKSLVP